MELDDHRCIQTKQVFLVCLAAAMALQLIASRTHEIPRLIPIIDSIHSPKQMQNRFDISSSVKIRFRYRSTIALTLFPQVNRSQPIIFHLLLKNPDVTQPTHVLLMSITMSAH